VNKKKNKKKNKTNQEVIFTIAIIGYIVLGSIILLFAFNEQQRKCENRIEVLKTYVSIPEHIVCQELKYTASNCSQRVFMACQSVSDDYIKKLLMGMGVIP